MNFFRDTIPAPHYRFGETPWLEARPDNPKLRVAHIVTTAGTSIDSTDEAFVGAAVMRVYNQRGHQ